MREPPVPDPLPEARVSTLDGVTVVRLPADRGYSVHEGRGDGSGRGLVVAANRYRPEGSYDPLYLWLTPDGLAEARAEREGVNPALFTGPDGELWARLSLTEDGSDAEPDTVLPLRGRAGTAEPPRTAPFAGEFVGWAGGRAFWHSDDLFDRSRPSRLQAVDVRPPARGGSGARFHFRRPVRLPLPQSSQAVVCEGGERLAVLAEGGGEAGGARLRILAADTLEAVTEVPVPAGPGTAWLGLLEAGPDGAALLYSVTPEGAVAVLRLDGAGGSHTVAAGALPDTPYSLWPVRRPGGHALRFTVAAGNGLLALGAADPRPGGPPSVAPRALWTSHP
ncbi:hypothetical protein, partial [Streptomyces sp. SM14]|uniref:hypothetical protein n=1 Tax=Streptomyces sp. SM14 TaxID=1736045 RepID=UPI001CA4EC5A